LSVNKLLFFYKLASTVGGLLGWPYFYWHLKSRGQGESFLPRLGLKLPEGPLPSGSPRLWLHGVSVGEIQAAVPLIRELKTLLPQAGLIISTGTETGQMLARKNFIPLGALVCYFPLDIPWSVQRYLDCLRPQVFIGLESEIWPNFLTQAHRRGVRLALVNGRLSDQSLRKYIKYSRYLSDIFDLFDTVAAGSEPDFQRFQRLGLAPHKLYLSGNLKYDRLFQGKDEVRLEGFKHIVHPGEAGGPVWLAASTHAGEEEVILEAYEKVLAPYPALELIIAPRHPQRAPNLGQLLASRGLVFQLWSRLTSGTETRCAPVVIIDTIGDLFTLYGLADVTFIGGSLVPHGGQNILESAAWGRAPIYGPHLENFLWAQAIMEEAEAGTMVNDGDSLAQAVQRFLDESEVSREMGRRAYEALIPHQGASRRQAELIAALINRGSGSPV
jgi:3-deoxy-D-manno-octulosonic-acid transferase